MLLLVVIASAGVFATNPMCWSESRIVHPDQAVGEALARRLQIRRVARDMPIDVTRSPNQGYAFNYANAKQPEQTASLLVFTESERLLEVRVEDVVAMTDVKWVNEKLIFFRVWFGRIAGADVILDVEKDRVVLTESMVDGNQAWNQFKEGCKATPDAPLCAPTCVRLK